jgi:hypothetical protein
MPAHKSPPLVPILNHVNPVHFVSTYFSKIHFNIILLSRGNPNGLFPSRLKKVNLSLRVTEHHAMVTYWGMEV